MIEASIRLEFYAKVSQDPAHRRRLAAGAAMMHTGYLIDTAISMYDGVFGVEWKTWDEFQEIVRTKFKRRDFSEMIDEIISKTEILMNDISLIRDMGQAAQKLQREKFSPDMRNRQVRQIYEQILH